MHVPARLTVLAALAGAALLVCSGADAVAADVTDTYADRAGDVRQGWGNVVPDIAQVTLVSSADGATVAFDVHLAATNNLTGGAPGEGLSWIYVAIDSDKNPATGGDWGDYVAYQIGPRRFAFRRWNGSAYADFPHQATAEHFNGTDLTFTLNTHDIGTTTFDFWIIGGNLGETDRAPDNGEYSYPPAISSLALPAALLRPKAGQIYRISDVALELDNGATAAPDALACTLSYRNKPLRPLTGGCAWKIPRPYRRKVLRLALTATYRGSTATSTFAVRPR